MRLIDRISRGASGTFWEGMASGAAVLTTSYGDPGRESLLPSLVSFAQQTYGDNCIVFGAVLARISLFAEIKLRFQDETNGSLTNLPPRAQILENPWPNGQLGDLCSRALQDVDLAGNAYFAKGADQLLRLAPQEVTIVSDKLTDTATGNTYRKVIGYFWDPTSPPNSPTFSDDTEFYTVDEVAHWSPIPDPMAMFKGMSWLTPVIREITADSAMTNYKIQYLSNAASPNLLLKFKQKLLPETIDSLRDRMKARHGGVDNAFKTLVLDQGADVQVIGNSFEQMAFSTVQAAGENRILIASGVPGIVIGSKEGLAAATYSNYAQAMRRFVDMTMDPLWRSFCACMSKLVPVPAGQRLWFDTSGIPACRPSEKDAADAMLVQAQAIGELVKFGYDPETVVKAVVASDMGLLKHPGIPIQITSDVPIAKPAPIVLGAPGQPAPLTDPNPASAAQAKPGAFGAPAAPAASTNGKPRS